MTRWWIASFSATAHTQEIGTRIWKEKKKKLTIFSIILHENSLFALGGHTLFWLVYVPLYSPPEREENPALSLDELDVVWIHSNDGLTEWVNKLSFSVYKRKEKGGEIDQPRTLYFSLSVRFNLSIPHSAWYPKKENHTWWRTYYGSIFQTTFYSVNHHSDKSIWAYLFTVARLTPKNFHFSFFEIHSLSLRALYLTASTDMMILSASKIDPRHLNMRFCGSSLFIHSVLRAVCVFVGFLCVVEIHANRDPHLFLFFSIVWYTRKEFADDGIAYTWSFVRMARPCYPSCHSIFLLKICFSCVFIARLFFVLLPHQGLLIISARWLRDFCIVYNFGVISRVSTSWWNTCSAF